MLFEFNLLQFMWDRLTLFIKPFYEPEIKIGPIISYQAHLFFPSMFKTILDLSLPFTNQSDPNHHSPIRSQSTQPSTNQT